MNLRITAVVAGTWLGMLMGSGQSPAPLASGQMLPGIGGALDLIDSLLWTGPVAWFYLKYACAV